MKVLENLYTDILIEDIEFETFDKEKLYYRVFKPKDWKEEDKRSCIVFYFGGGFIASNIEHFRMQSEYLAHRGMVCITPLYRTANKSELGIEVCYKDALSGFNDIIKRADILGIDINKIVLSGGSAGGALANYIALKYIEMNNNIPCSQILFNPKLYELPVDSIKPEFVENDLDIVDVEGEKIDMASLIKLQKCFGEKFFNWNKSLNNFGYHDTLKRMENFLIDAHLL